MRLGLPLPDDTERALAPLADEDADVRWWAWLTAVRWAEVEPERQALREAVAKRAPEADPLAAPIAAWAAMLMNCATGLTPALARSLARPPTEIGDALSLVSRLGAQLEDLSQLLEPLIDGPDEAIACSAVYALMQNTPHRWRRVWALTSETQLHTSPERRPHGPPHTWTDPTARATSARFALGGAAERLGADAAATFVEHTDQWWVIPIITGLGPHARAAAPALVAKLEAAMGTQYPQVRELVAALGAVGGPIAWQALERLAATHERIAVHLGGLGRSAASVIGRLLAAPLAPEVHEALLDGLGAMQVPEPSLAPAVLPFLESPNLDLRLFAIYAAGAFELDDTTAVRLASTFAACAAEVPPFRRPLQYAAHSMTPTWASRIDHESDIIAVRCIEALGWTRQYGEDHLPALRAIAARAPTSLRGRYALEAAERISDPEPMFGRDR